MIPSYCRTTKQEQREIDCRFPYWFSFLKACLSGTLLFLLPVYTVVGQTSLLSKTISIPRQSTTIYKALNLISEKADVFFVYDSQVVESDKHIKLFAEHQTIKQVLDNLLANPDLQYREIGQHILIYRRIQVIQPPGQITPVVPIRDTIRQIILKGYVFDNQSKNPLPYANIGIEKENLGTVTNADGYFVLKVPPELIGSTLVVSHLGFMSRKIPTRLLDEQQVDIFLDRRVISIQEVIIRYVDPTIIVAKAMQVRKDNYSLDPVFMTTFYREGVQKNDRFLNYSEAVFKVYKSPVDMSEHFDQVKLIKSRKVQNVNQEDTINLKLKAGVLTGLQLDIVKCIPSFLDQSQMSLYNYTYSDLVSNNSQDVYAISFVQKNGIDDALFVGTLYIDKESYAILGADFEINPAYLDKAANDMVLKKSRNIIVKLEKINYTIRYTSFNGRYYLNHARGEIQLRTRIRNHFSSNKFTTFLEIATCQIDTVNVMRFGRQEVIKPDVVFTDAPFVYDYQFWGDYNIITPEEKLNEALSRIKSKIEKIE